MPNKPKLHSMTLREAKEAGFTDKQWAKAIVKNCKRPEIVPYKTREKKGMDLKNIMGFCKDTTFEWKCERCQFLKEKILEAK